MVEGGGQPAWTGVAWIGLDGRAWQGMGLDCWARIRSMARRPGREHGERCEHGEPLSFDALVPVLSPPPISRSNGDEKQKKKHQLASCMPTVTAYTSTLLHLPPVLRHPTINATCTAYATAAAVPTHPPPPHRQNPSAPRQPCSLLFGTPSHGSRTLLFWTAVAKITAAACCPMRCPPPSTAAATRYKLWPGSEPSSPGTPSYLSRRVWNLPPSKGDLVKYRSST
jgi:hypothetical protein